MPKARPLADALAASQSSLLGRSPHLISLALLIGNYRGTKGFYQRWANLVGDQSWSWDNILPYFKKSVEFTPPSTAKMGVNANISYDPAAYEQGGPLHMAYSNYYQPMNPGLIKGFEALNFSAQTGFSSGVMDGYGYLVATIDPDTQLKDSSETAFLPNAMNNSNFKLYKNTIAKKILFDGNKAATGVQVETAGSLYTLNAAKEVIVSAGVVSPCLPSHNLANALSDTFSPNAHGIRHWSESNSITT